MYTVNHFSVAHVLAVEVPRPETLSTARIASRHSDDNRAAVVAKTDADVTPSLTRTYKLNLVSSNLTF